MASGLIVSWQIDWETMEMVTDFIFLGSKITADGTTAMASYWRCRLPTRTASSDAKVIDCADHNKLWKILRETGISEYFTCFLRNLCASQEATVRTRCGTTDWFQIGKGVCQGCILLPCLFNLYAEYIMRNAGLDEHKLESRLMGEISITSDMQMTPPLWPKAKRN